MCLDQLEGFWDIAGRDLEDIHARYQVVGLEVILLNGRNQACFDQASVRAKEFNGGFFFGIQAAELDLGLEGVGGDLECLGFIYIGGSSLTIISTT